MAREFPIGWFKTEDHYPFYNAFTTTQILPTRSGISKTSGRDSSFTIGEYKQMSLGAISEINSLHWIDSQTS